VALRGAWLLASTPHGMPVAGSFSDGFGWRQDPFAGGPEFHKGIDLVAPAGNEPRIFGGSFAGVTLMLVRWEQFNPERSVARSVM